MSSTTDPDMYEFVDLMYPLFVSIVANTALSASLFTLFVVLLALSTKESRRHAAFRLNVLAICIVLTMGVLIAFHDVKSIMLDMPPTSVTSAAIAFLAFPPLLCDSILLTRLLALYPLSTTPLATLLKIFAFPFCVKCARVVVLTLFLRGYFASPTIELVFRNPNLIAEWAMQIADNLYSVSFFLYNLHVRTRPIKCAGGIPARIRQIFYISAANFVFPLIFSIALISTFVTYAPFYATGYLLQLINNYVTVMGVLCATLWFSGSEWVRSCNEPILPGDIFALRPNLLREHDAGRRCGGEVVVIGRRFGTPDTAELELGP